MGTLRIQVKLTEGEIEAIKNLSLNDIPVELVSAMSKLREVATFWYTYLVEPSKSCSNMTPEELITALSQIHHENNWLRQRLADELLTKTCNLTMEELRRLADTTTQGAAQTEIQGIINLRRSFIAVAGRDVVEA